MLYDFTNFEQRIEKLNDLNKQIHTLSDVRLKTNQPEDIKRWNDAVDKWYNYSGFGKDINFYYFESDSFLQKLKSGAPDAVECAITFLELDPYYYRSGYMKMKIVRRLKHLQLVCENRLRLQKVILSVIKSLKPKSEFREYLNLIPMLLDDKFQCALRNIEVPDTPWHKKRKSLVVEHIK